MSNPYSRPRPGAVGGDLPGVWAGARPGRRVRGLRLGRDVPPGRGPGPPRWKRARRAGFATSSDPAACFGTPSRALRPASRRAGFRGDPPPGYPTPRGRGISRRSDRNFLVGISILVRPSPRRRGPLWRCASPAGGPCGEVPAIAGITRLYSYIQFFNVIPANAESVLRPWLSQEMDRIAARKLWLMDEGRRSTRRPADSPQRIRPRSTTRRPFRGPTPTARRPAPFDPVGRLLYRVTRGLAWPAVGVVGSVWCW